MPKTLRTLAWAVPLAGAALVLAWLLAVLFLPWDLLYWGEISAGNALVSKIEVFKSNHGRLPDPKNVQEVVGLGFELRTGYYPQYRPFGRDHYEIEYNMVFDGPRIIYSSSTSAWRCELCN